MPAGPPAPQETIRARQRISRVWLAAWLALAFLAGNGVYERYVIAAGRRFVIAARAQTTGPYLRIDDWMGAAVARGRRRGTAAAVFVLAAGLAARAGARWARAHPEKTS
jgi:hypothetical protein